MEQTKNTNKLPSYASQSCNLGLSVCHMSSGGQVKGSVAKLQLFLAALPSLFPGSRPNPWCQGPSFHQLGHLNSRPQSSWPFSPLYGCCEDEIYLRLGGNIIHVSLNTYFWWTALEIRSQKPGQNGFPRPLAPPPRTGLERTANMGWAQLTAASKRKKEQKLEMCSKPEVHYRKWSELPKGLPGKKKGVITDGEFYTFQVATATYLKYRSLIHKHYSLINTLR